MKAGLSLSLLCNVVLRFYHGVVTADTGLLWCRPQLMALQDRSDRTAEASTSCSSSSQPSLTDTADAVAAAAAGTLAQTLSDAGFSLGRLKTGTPPRLAADTIDFSNLEHQPGDQNPLPFSFMHMGGPGWRPHARQVSCFGTRTTAASEAWVNQCVAAGRGARFGADMLGVTQGGCTEPR